MVSSDGKFLMAFHVVDIFQDLESMSHTFHADFSQIVSGKYHESFAVDLVFCSASQSMVASLWRDDPTKEILTVLR